MPLRRPWRQGAIRQDADASPTAGARQLDASAHGELSNATAVAAQADVGSKSRRPPAAAALALACMARPAVGVAAPTQRNRRRRLMISWRALCRLRREAAFRAAARWRARAQAAVPTAAAVPAAKRRRRWRPSVTRNMCRWPRRTTTHLAQRSHSHHSRLGYTQRWIWGGFGVDLGWIPVYISKRTNFYNKSTAVLRVLLFTQNA